MLYCIQQLGGKETIGVQQILAVQYVVLFKGAPDIVWNGFHSIWDASLSSQIGDFGIRNIKSPDTNIREIITVYVCVHLKYSEGLEMSCWRRMEISWTM